jgi:hypothetical protein
MPSQLVFHALKYLNQHPQGGNCRNDCRQANDGNEKLSLAWSQGSGCDR